MTLALSRNVGRYLHVRSELDLGPILRTPALTFELDRGPTPLKEARDDQCGTFLQLAAAKFVPTFKKGVVGRRAGASHGLGRSVGTRCGVRAPHSRL